MSVVDKQLFIRICAGEETMVQAARIFQSHFQLTTRGCFTYILFLHTTTLCGVTERLCLFVSYSNVKESAENHFCLILIKSFNVRLGKIILSLKLDHLILCFSAALLLSPAVEAISSSEWVDKQLSNILLPFTRSRCITTEAEPKCQILSSPLGIYSL